MRKRGTHLIRYRDFLQAARSKVYGANLSATTNGGNSATPRGLDSDQDIGLSNPPERIDSETVIGTESTAGNGMESYFNEVSGYFDSTLLGLDDYLAAWHDAFLDEIQTTRLDDR